MCSAPASDRIAPPYVRLIATDNVVVLTRHVDEGDLIAGTADEIWAVDAHLDAGNKLAARSIDAGERITKAGVAIGTATQAIEPGALVHSHNLRSDYIPTDFKETRHGIRSVD
jgi:altronate dehydratase small subunit